MADAEQWTPAEREAWKAAYRADKPVHMPLPEHGPGECDYCDTIRALMAEVDSEGEESTMHTGQPDMVRASLEATAHPDVYARRKVAAKVRDVASERVAIIDGATPFDAMAVGEVAAQVVVGSDLRAPVAEVEGDHDDPDQCTCPTTPRDADGNCDLIEQDDCPVHGAAEAANIFPEDAERERVVGEVFQSFGTHVLGLPPDADVKAALTECICATREVNQACPAHGFTDAGMPSQPDTIGWKCSCGTLNLDRPGYQRQWCRHCGLEYQPSLPDSADMRLHTVTDGAFFEGLGRRREGWRGRLAHVEMLLTRARESAWHSKDEGDIDVIQASSIDQALTEVRALIDEG